MKMKTPQLIASAMVADAETIMDYLRTLPVEKMGELPLIPVDERKRTEGNRP